MTIGAALVLIAVGAILRFAITTVSTHGIGVHTIGDILMLVGVLGLVLWMIVWAPWGTRRRRTVYRRQVPPDEEVVTTRRYRDDDPYYEDDYRR